MPFLLQHHMKLHHPPVRASSAFAPTTSEAGVVAAATYGRSPVIAEPTELHWNLSPQEQQEHEAVMPNDFYLHPHPPPLPQRASNALVDGCTLLDPMDWVPDAHWQNDDEKGVRRSIELDEQDEKEDRMEDSNKRSLWMDREPDSAGSASSLPLHNNNNNNNHFVSAARSQCQTAQPLSSPPSLLTLVRRPSVCHPPFTQPPLQQQLCGMEEQPLLSSDLPDSKNGAATAVVTDLYPAVLPRSLSPHILHGAICGEEDDTTSSAAEDVQRGELSPLLLGGVMEGNHPGGLIRIPPFSTSPSSTVRCHDEDDDEDEKEDTSNNYTTSRCPPLPPPVLLQSNDDRSGEGSATTTAAMPPILLMIPSSTADCLLLAHDHHHPLHRTTSSHDSSLSAGAAVSTLDVLEWSMCDSLGCLSVQSTPQKPSEEGGTINHRNSSASSVNGSSSSSHSNSSLYAIRAVQNNATSPQALCF